MVTVKSLTVHWHQDSSPIYSVCFQPGNNTRPNRSNRLVTGGGDNNVRVWRLKLGADPTEPPQVEYLATLANHTSAVNCVSFDPFGNILASAGDDGVIRLWCLSSASGTNALTTPNLSEFEDTENWKLLRLCRCVSSDEIYDLSWSPNGKYLAATSMDRVVSIIDIRTGSCVAALRDHRHYVQGVSWDPKGELLATQSSDQRVLVYSVKETDTGVQFHLINRLERSGDISFHPESFSSFFRRLAFSPDGALLVIPAARKHSERSEKHDKVEPTVNQKTEAQANDVLSTDNNEPSHASTALSDDYTECALLFTRSELRTPSAVIPLPKPSLAAQFCPILFECTVEAPLIKLPYRMVYAIATLTSVFLYDTESETPLGMASNLHYSSITDIAWSPDGRLLILTSIDGFCSAFRFEKNELGIPCSQQPAECSATLDQQQHVVQPEQLASERVLQHVASQPLVVNTLSVRKKPKSAL